MSELLWHRLPICTLMPPMPKKMTSPVIIVISCGTWFKLFLFRVWLPSGTQTWQWHIPSKPHHFYYTDVFSRFYKRFETSNILYKIDKHMLFPSYR
jgi:hypothetical protein